MGSVIQTSSRARSMAPGRQLEGPSAAGGGAPHRIVLPSFAAKPAATSGWWLRIANRCLAAPDWLPAHYLDQGPPLGHFAANDVALAAAARGFSTKMAIPVMAADSLPTFPAPDFTANALH